MTTTRTIGGLVLVLGLLASSAAQDKGKPPGGKTQPRRRL